MVQNSVAAVFIDGLALYASQLRLPRRVEKENLAAFIAKKREIFMVHMSLDIKRQELRRLAQQAAQVIHPLNPLPVLCMAIERQELRRLAQQGAQVMRPPDTRLSNLACTHILGGTAGTPIHAELTTDLPPV